MTELPGISNIGQLSSPSSETGLFSMQKFLDRISFKSERDWNSTKNDWMQKSNQKFMESLNMRVG